MKDLQGKTVLITGGTSPSGIAMIDLGAVIQAFSLSYLVLVLVVNMIQLVLMGFFKKED